MRSHLMKSGIGRPGPQPSSFSASSLPQTSAPVSSFGAAPAPRIDAAAMDTKIGARHLSLFYGQKQALRNVSIEMAANQVTALIGPSGCGESTFLRTLNRM